MSEKLDLIEPTAELREAFLAMLEEFRGTETTHLDEHLRLAREDFDAYLRRLRAIAAGDNPPGNWSERMYWLVRDGHWPLGVGYLRPKLPEEKQRSLGHIGYYVRVAARKQGYGTAMMRLLMDKAREEGMSRLMLVCRAGTASARVIEKNGGKLDSQFTRAIDGVVCRRYWVDL